MYLKYRYVDSKLKSAKLDPLLADYSDLQNAYFLNINVLCIPLRGTCIHRSCACIMIKFSQIERQVNVCSKCLYAK